MTSLNKSVSDSADCGELQFRHMRSKANADIARGNNGICRHREISHAEMV
jgi:hypothetical protein